MKIDAASTGTATREKRCQGIPEYENSTEFGAPRWDFLRRRCE
jgi:hypothetical protein